MPNHHELANLIWQIADLLRGPYRPPQYERVMLPMTVLRRFDSVLAPTKPKVLAEYARRKGGQLEGDALDRKLNHTAGQRFHNHSPLDFERLKGDPDNVEKHLVGYIKGFSKNVRDIFDFFEFENEIERMREANILYLVVSKFADVDLHPAGVPNAQMGLVFENLIRRFNELANETAGDHFTPREVIRLMVNLLFIDDDKLLATPQFAAKLLDPACGTGGMLAEAQSYLRDHHAQARLYTYGQDYNKRAFATAASDMLMKEVAHNGSGDNVRFGDSFIEDQFRDERFDYFLTNPPFGVDWKKQQKEIEREHEKLGAAGRFGAGLPRVNDGALLFLQHMISKFEPVLPAQHKHGSRLAIVFSGSPLFTGGAGSGESDIRKWIIENDWLEGIIALPEQMFYNTGIGTYVWIVTNRKEKRRKGKIQLLDARDRWQPGGSEESKRTLGDKRRHMSNADIAEAVKLHGRFAEGELSKIYDNADFGYTRVTVERPLRLRFEMTAAGEAHFLESFPKLRDDLRAIRKALGPGPRHDWTAVWGQVQDLLHGRKSRWKGGEEKLFRAAFTRRDPQAEPVAQGGRGEGFEPDADLRFFENVPLKDDIAAYFEREVRPHAPDAWIDRTKDKVGYEINFSRYFYRYAPPRTLGQIDDDLRRAGEEITRQSEEVTRAVTRGLDPKIRLRDSGVAWIGQVPEHWDVIALRFLVSIVGGATPDTGKPALWNGEIPWVSPKDMKRDEIEDAEDHVTPLALESTALQLIDPGAVLIVVRGMILAHSFPTAITTSPITINQDMKALRCRDRLVPRFLREFLRGAEPQLVALADASAHGTRKLESEVLGRVEVCVPPLDEQQAIVAHIQRETTRLQALREATERALVLLSERRAALVAAAVTGRINVTAMDRKGDSVGVA